MEPALDAKANPPTRRQISAEAQAIIAGLMAENAWIAPKYFYDPLGSRLFEIITTLPEYYPTRLERDIFLQSIGAIQALVGTGSTLIDLGAGNCAKAESLFAALRPQQYVAVDISSEYLSGVLRGLQQRHPGIDVFIVATDFSSELSLPATIAEHARLFFFPGSSIGNFTPPQAGVLLRQIHSQCARGGHLLIGVDLLKGVNILEAAYNDPLGITAAFNLNVLNHVNSLISSNFAVAGWRHRAFFNEIEGRIEMHLTARYEQTVNWPGGRRTFASGEQIHTENSYKYDLDAFRHLLAQSGFDPVHCWTDPARWFAVILGKAI
jgi:dimethylhistidine N-methyltransferase